VRNNNELGVILKFFQEFNEPANISVVERGVNFVKNTKWAGLDEIDGKKQGEGSESFFSTAELFDALTLTVCSEFREALRASTVMRVLIWSKVSWASARTSAQRVGHLIGRSAEHKQSDQPTLQQLP